MGTETQELAGILARALAERVAGRGTEAGRLYEQAAEAARAAGDLVGWTDAVLGRAGVQVFGAEPGRLPSMLYDVLVRTTDDRSRSRLAAALARCWVYANQTERGLPFAEEAVERARLAADPAQLADALDAALSVRWGPDDLEARRDLTRELDDVAAHLADPEMRLQAHLWSLHVACEALDLHAMNRQIRSLEVLGEESPRARFFASTRRSMLDLMRGRPDTVSGLLAAAEAAAEEVLIPDSWAVIAVNSAYAAIQTGDLVALEAVAAGAEAFALEEGIATVAAEAAFLWVAAGRLDKVEELLRGFADGRLSGLPRDQDWMLGVQLTLEAALAVGDRDLIGAGVELLLPYAGRAVVNSGAVMFHGVTDDPLSRALALLGRPDEAALHRDRALKTYERIGATWWRQRLEAAEAPTASVGTRVHLHPTGAGLWAVGRAPTPVAGLRGFGYLRTLARTPGVQHRALDLVGASGPVVEEGGLGEVADRQALAAYRGRLADIDAEIAEAEEWADAARLEAARSERDALLDELGRAAGLGGGPRVTGSSQERARVAVKKAISTAIGRIAEIDADLAKHLRNSVRTGLWCSYEPEPGAAPDWVLEV